MVSSQTPSPERMTISASLIVCMSAKPCQKRVDVMVAMVDHAVVSLVLYTLAQAPERVVSASLGVTAP